MGAEADVSASVEASCIDQILEGVIIGLWIFMMVKAAHEEAYALPVIGELAQKSAAERLDLLPLPDLGVRVSSRVDVELEGARDGFKRASFADVVEK